MPCFLKYFYRVVFLLLLPSSVYSETCRIAVAANFSATAKKLKQQFEQAHAHKIKLSTGSTGQLFAHIQNGAPFDIFLAADQKRPALLIKSGHVATLKNDRTLINYAQGVLALWSPKQGLNLDQNYLNLKKNMRIAMANPKIAPYGQAAKEVLKKTTLPDKAPPKIIYAASVAQTMMFIASGNVDMGFIALSQIKSRPKLQQGSWWLPPQSMYTPLIQQAVLLREGKKNKAALAFMTYLNSQKARDTIIQMGYLK